MGVEIFHYLPASEGGSPLSEKGESENVVISVPGFVRRALGPVARRARRVRARTRRSIRISSDDGRGAVFTLPLEDYVAGAVAAETSEDWENEALEAQVVVTRSFSLHRVMYPRSRRYDVLSPLDQGFVLPRLAPGRVQDAVAATRGEYLTKDVSGRRSPAPLRTLFHSSCGGGTDRSSSVWGGADDDGEAEATCVHCLRSPQRWTTTPTQDELLRAVGLPPDPSAAVRIEATARTPSGRISAVRISSGDSVTVISADTLRAVLGYESMRSARFEWMVSPEGIRLQGVGAGHGVGLCQRGACGLAADGWTYPEILAHYYPRSRLVRPK